MKPYSAKSKIVAMVLLAGVLPLLVSLGAHFLIGDAPRVQEPLHGAVELAGTCIALGVAALLLLRLRHETASPHLLWVVAALVAMGLVDGLHAVHGISLQSWQRHGATLLGGVLFGLVWLPLSPAVIHRKGRLVLIVAGLALALGLWWGSEWMPVTWDPVGLYTFPVKAVNALGGLSFLVAALFFCRRYLRQAYPEDLVFIGLSVLFGMSSLLFGVSHTWAADWWVWHGFRLLAYAIVLVVAYEMVVTLYQQIGEHALELEGRVQERTADLRHTNEVLQGQITERHRAEAELDRLFEVSPDMICIIGFDGCFKRLNPAWEKTLGHSPDDLLSKPFVEFVHPEDHEATNAEAAKLAQGARALRFENRYRCKDGSYRWLSWAVIPAMEERLLYCVTRDITQRRQAEAEVERRGEEQGRLNADLTRSNRATLNLMQDAVQAKSRLEQANRKLQLEIAERQRAEAALQKNQSLLTQAEKMGKVGGWEFDIETKQQTWTETVYDIHEVDITCQPTVDQGINFYTPASQPIIERAVQRAIEQGEPFDVELEIITAKGNLRSVHAIGKADLARRKISGFFQDITERKQAEEEIRQLNTELEQRVVKRTAQLVAANKELEAFSYSVSHDLRAPLRHVQGYVDMLAREISGLLSDKGRRYMTTIADASREMGVLIDDLLAFSRMSHAEMCETSVNLDKLVQDTLRDLEPAMRERNFIWKIPSLPAVQADSAMLKLALTNLLGNAVKFTRPRDPAQIEMGCAGTEDGRVAFFVRDNGVGFDPQYAHKLFGVFQRLHRADEFEGTGIGLASVRRIIARHGGRTWAEGALDRGATFYFTLKPSTSTP